MKYRKKPITVDAYQFSNRIGHEIPEWLQDAVGREAVTVHSAGSIPYMAIRTLEGDMRADIGDWIIKGVVNELYPCKSDIFEATYNPVDETE